MSDDDADRPSGEAVVDGVDGVDGVETDGAATPGHGPTGATAAVTPAEAGTDGSGATAAADRGGVATKSRVRLDKSDRDDADAAGRDGARPTGRGGKGRATPRNPRGGNGLVRFVREIVAELRKVLWPTRRELIVYTVVVIIFVAVMISIVAGLDFGFARLVLWVFG